jgi:predicted permease
MNWIKQLFSRRRLYSDLSEEIQEHLEEKIDELVAGGMSREDATLAARREFGNVTLLEERGREVWQWPSLESFLADIRYGLRQLRLKPGFTIVATLTLALGIGANTAIFSVINAVMLRLLPVQNPEGLVQVAYQGQHINQAFVAESFSYPQFKEFRERNQVFTDMAGVAPWQFAVQFGRSGPDAAAQNLEGQFVSANFFSALGINAVAGRVFAADEDNGAHPVAVISYALWTRAFARDPRAIGRKVKLGSPSAGAASPWTPVTIIGVAPAHFDGLDPGQAYDLWVPVTMQPQVNGCECGLLTHYSHTWLNLFGRLRPRVSPQQARANLDLVFQQIQRQQDTSSFSETQRKDFFTYRIVVLPAARGTDYLRKEFSRPLFLLMGLVALVLVIACANVANLLLARASVRQREIAVRLALGASRRRLVRQLLTESVLLAFIGGALGVVSAFWGSRVLVTLMAGGRNQLTVDVHPDLSVLGLTLLVALATGIAFGLAPALRATRTGAGPSLQAYSHNLTGSHAGLGLGQAMVVAQVALSLVLVIGAGLLVRTLRNLETFDAGFSRQGVLRFGLAPTVAGYKDERLAHLYQQLQEAMSQMPGVRSVSFSLVTPISGVRLLKFISVEGYTPQPHEDMGVSLNSVGPRFFETLGTPLLIGRDFGSQDHPGSPRVAIINQAMARRFFAGRNPIGGKFGWGQGKDKQEFEIIGVVRDAKYLSLREEMPPTAYVYALQGKELGDFWFEVRASSNPIDLMPQIRSLLRSVDSRLTPWDPKTLAEQVDQSLYQEKLVSTLSSFFGVLALLLACVGLYGIMAYAVVRQTNEIGIRMALGAESSRILRMVLREALLLVAIGVAIGLPAAWAATHAVSSLLYGVKLTDPFTILASTLLMVALTALAGYLPARRAARVDPMVALRYE